MRYVAAALLLTGCASVPVDLNQGGVPLGRSGWQLSGGVDMEKHLYYVLFWRPWGKAEKETADGILLPE